MNKYLYKKFARLESSRKNILSTLKTFNPESLNKKPAGDKWSSLQILFHIIKSEQLTTISVKRALKEYDKKVNTGLPETLKTALLKIILITPLKFKAPRVVADIPDQPGLEEMIARWSSIRSDIKDLLETIPAEAMKKNIFNHPFSGKMNIFHTTDFLISHSEHHYRQIKKLNRISKNYYS
jgi:hypothetical protein